MLKKIIAIIAINFVLLSGANAGTKKPLRVYLERSKGEVEYVVLNPDRIEEMYWIEDDKKIQIIISGRVYRILVKSEIEALKIIESVMGSHEKDWINTDKL